MQEMLIIFGFLYNVYQSDTCPPEPRVQVGVLHQAGLLSQLVSSKIACSSFIFSTCTTQGSSVWWCLPDNCIVWACLRQETEGGAGQRGFNCSKKKQWQNKTFKSFLFFYDPKLFVVSVVNYTKKWQKRKLNSLKQYANMNYP